MELGYVFVVPGFVNRYVLLLWLLPGTGNHKFLFATEFPLKLNRNPPFSSIYTRIVRKEISFNISLSATMLRAGMNKNKSRKNAPVIYRRGADLESRCKIFCAE